MSELAPELPRRDLYRLVVDVRALTTAEGGREGPIASGYRPDCWFGLSDELGRRLLHGCHFYFRAGADTFESDGSLWLPVGGLTVADVLVRQPALLRERIQVGGSVDAQEGLKVTARGRIMEIIDPGPRADP